ncbi:FadR/GntR family transcriptional regulator [Tenuifilum thalassicum]|uniref:FadR family transcriptional regulator n=1 Tax=Tenuifilum thalassicum TaxID=2590900 RepID=A0A7D4BJC2_9BACT|nr:FadR/GntR family transcriptional regulator [Tenuifilum thalassicum]QKG79459.1 FadR family transcriptional regulator [Tenuifilum thalassicum]
MDILESLKTIEVESPVNQIIKQIRSLIITGKLKPGDKLPSERKLSESLGIGRTYVRDAIKKLEFYGILKTMPQSGTVVAGIDISAMEGLISNVIHLHDNDFFHLVETRVLLEVFACSQAALRRTDGNILELKTALSDHKKRVEAGLPGVKEDLNFHIKIAEASQNMVVKSMLLILIPDIIEIYRKLNVCGEGRFYQSFNQHEEILNCIINRDPQGAETKMREHLKHVYEFSKSYKQELR